MPFISPSKQQQSFKGKNTLNVKVDFVRTVPRSNTKSTNQSINHIQSIRPIT